MTRPTAVTATDRGRQFNGDLNCGSSNECKVGFFKRVLRMISIEQRLGLTVVVKLLSYCKN